MRGLVKNWDVSKGMELLPGDALRVSDPVFVAAGIATGRLAFVEHGHVGVLSSRLHLNQLLGTINLEGGRAGVSLGEVIPCGADVVWNLVGKGGDLASGDWVEVDFFHFGLAHSGVRREG